MKRPTRYKLLPPVSSILPALLSGVLLLLAFPPFSIPGIGAVAFVPLLLVLLRGKYTRAESFRIGYLFGVTFFVLLLWWIKDLLPWANVTIPWLMTPALILAVLYLALYPAFFSLLLRWIGGGRKSTALMVAPALWTLMELIRSRGEIGFPWGSAGYSVSDYPRFIQAASFVGVYGMSFIVLAINSLFAAALLSRGFFRRIAFTAAGLAVIAANGIVGDALMAPDPKPALSRFKTIAVVQPNIDLRIKWDPSYTDSIFSSFEYHCRSVLPLEPSIYIFPETAAPVYIKYEPRYRQRIVRLARELQTPIFIGYLDARRDESSQELNIYNAAGLFEADGRLAMQYEKVHLLPFGEALPLSWKFPVLKKINFGQGNFHPGTSLHTIPFGEHSFGTLICFESIFPELSRRYAANGAGFLVNITNDGWFGDTPGPVQHAQMCIMRAVENRRYLVRSANTGISMVVDPWGRVVAAIGLDREGTIVEKITVSTERTFYTRHGEIPVLALSLALIALGILRTSIRRRSPSVRMNSGATRNRT
jgi:apolipoprotein N-acyltransferase